LNTPHAAAVIKRTIKAARGRLSVGAGTVLDESSLKAAINAGASFIVSPVLVKEVAIFCRREKIAFFPGALTPQEIYCAWQAGAAMVKVFPAGFFGPAYFKEIKAPFEHIKLLACGGVNAANIAEFFKNGADAAAFGGSVFNKDLFADKEFSRIGDNVKMLIAGYFSRREK
jgi:2-dehydro-3-deoxyphosphogluconate aldolase/(4S)-4-hydroxy-2-oxoglutarate aldolase